ncbi:MAG: DUF86 domain-containing protein [Anaerolineae bacterium]|nr:DUF86 domain-containing protein [Anaerolineae bacterium]
MDDEDLIRLRHMLEAAQAAVAFVEGKTRAALDDDLQLVFALRKAIEIIGEAATKITPNTRQRYPQMPWREMIGMRNILIHDYYDVDLDQLWHTVIDDLPPLITELEKILS